VWSSNLAPVWHIFVTNVGPVWVRLVAEHGAMCSEVTVTRYVAKRRIELSLHHIEVAVPQTHEPGAEAEVDFGEFWTRIGGMPVKCWMFVMRLSCSLETGTNSYRLRTSKTAVRRKLQGRH
jgi:transposase